MLVNDGEWDGWRDLAVMASATVGRRFGDGDLVVGYRVADGPAEHGHHQVFDRGTLVAWERGPGRRADLVLRQPWPVHVAMLSGAGRGGELLAATEVVDPGGGVAWPPPLDELRSGWAAALPEVPAGGRLVVQQVLTHSPFGEVATYFEVEGGRVVGGGVGEVETPDVHARRRYAQAIAERAGELDLFESFEGGYVAGGTPDLTYFLGVYDSDLCRAARRRLARPHCTSLAMLGELLASDVWRSAVAPLARLATDVESVP